MSDYDLVFPRVKAIEGLLEQRWGASGRGLHEKLDSVKDKLDSRIVSQGRFIASVRNKVAHEDGYQLDDPSGFVQACERVEQYLREASPVAPHAAVGPRPAAAHRASGATGKAAPTRSPGQSSPFNLLEHWRGSYVLWLWLSVGLYAAFFGLRQNADPWNPTMLYSALFLTGLAGMQTFLSDGGDSPNALSAALVLPPAAFLAATVGSTIGGLSGAILVFVLSVAAFYALFIYLGIFISPVIRLCHWISRGLYKLVTYSLALSITVSILWAIVQFFIRNWQPG